MAPLKKARFEIYYLFDNLVVCICGFFLFSLLVWEVNLGVEGFGGGAGLYRGATGK